MDRINILLVDDRPENLISLAALLDRPDYNLVMAGSGKEALRHLLMEDFALILLDVQMPILDGFETAALIKQRDRTKHIPIIFVTAFSGDEPFICRGYQSGAVDYVIKPIDPTILRSKVGVFAELHRKTVALQRQAELVKQNEKLEREKILARLEMDRMKRERALNEKYRELVEGITNGIVWTMNPVSREFALVSASVDGLLGYSNTAWTQDSNKIWPGIVHEEDREVFDCLIENGIVGTGTSNVEHRVLKSNGDVAWFQTSVWRANELDLGVGELRGLSIDVTRLKEAEESAKKAIRTRDEFLSIASHELRTPLTPLKLHLQNVKRMLRKDMPPEELIKKVCTSLDSSERQIERLTRLVEELLDVSRITNGKLTLVREEFDFSEMVRELCQRYSEEFVRSQCELTLEADVKVAGAWDRMRMEQVFINLLTNATKYGVGKPVHVKVYCDGDTAVLEVRDRGIGIRPEDQERIFSQFERAASSNNFGGLGLGLFIVSQILKAHGGQIGVESKLGHGSLFRVRIPTRATHGLTVGAAPAVETISFQSGG